MNLSKKLLIPIVAVSAFALSIFSVFTYTYVKREVLNIYRDHIDSAVQNLEDEVRVTDKLTDFVMARNDGKNLALAKAFAEILRLGPESVFTLAEMERIADLLGVEEVHVADERGILVAGNEPVYYDYDFRDADQSRVFVDLLDNPQIEIAQELRENGFGQWYRYYGVKRTDAKGFVQVGVGYDVAKGLQDVLDIGNKVKVTTVGKEGFAAIIQNGVVTAHGLEELVGNQVEQEPWYDQMQRAGSGYMSIDIGGERCYTGFSHYGDQLILAAMPEREIYGGLDAFRRFCISMYVLSSLLMILILYRCLRSFVLKPIRHITDAMGRLAGGDLNATVSPRYTGEFGQLRDAINHTVGRMNGYIADVSKILTHMAQDNYDVDVTGEYPGDFLPIKQGLNRIIERINLAMADVSASSHQIAVSAQQISMASQMLSQGASEQASSIEFVSSTIGAISGRTRNTADISGGAYRLACSTAENAQMGNVQMRRMMQAIEGIGEETGNIAKMVDTIEDIAMQTNLLALNAAVEAVRAGQYGRGFAVVAEQVRELATSSQRAVQEATGMLESTVFKVSEGKLVASDCSLYLERIVREIGEISAEVEKVTKDAAEQDSSIQVVNAMIEQIAQVTEENSDTSREAAVTAEELHGQAETFRQMVANFKLKPEIQTHDYRSAQRRPSGDGPDLFAQAGAM